MFTSRTQPDNASQDNANSPKSVQACDEVSAKQMLHHHWESYAKLKIADPNVSRNQTGLFFQSLPLPLNTLFRSSTRQIVHFGICTGDYHTDQQEQDEMYGVPYDKKIIGYDISESAISHITSKGMQGRVVDLNDADDEKKVSYHGVLSKDLSIASDILIIRTLEYLNPKAVQLFLFSLLAFAAPGSRIFIEIYGSDISNECFPNTNIPQDYFIKPGFVSSFFAPRTDMQFLHRTIVENGINESSSRARYTVVERLIIEKQAIGERDAYVDSPRLYL